MEENKLIRNQLLKNMLYNFLAFTIIFTVFGAIIFKQISISLYNNVDQELLNAKDRIPISVVLELDNSIPNISINDISRQVQSRNISPGIIYIVRDRDGNILNKNSIGRLYNEYMDSISFDKNNLDSIQNIKVDNYNYRETSFKVQTMDGGVLYIQLLVNIDSETRLINNFFQILILGIGFTIVLAIIASYLLSKKTLKPIMESWNKQIEFVQNASHELRTPLSIIQAKQDLLLKEPDKTIFDKSEDIILTLNETRRLSKLTSDLMTLARADSNKDEINRKIVNIDELIQNVTNPYIEIAQAQKKKVELNLNYGKEINIDTNRIHQLMVILLDNAIKYTEKKDIIQILTYEKDGKFLLEVKDTGIGIGEEAIKHIFERFYREDKSRSREKGRYRTGTFYRAMDRRITWRKHKSCA